MPGEAFLPPRRGLAHLGRLIDGPPRAAPTLVLAVDDWRVYGANTARARTLVFELALLHFTADNVPICGAQRA